MKTKKVSVRKKSKKSTKICAPHTEESFTCFTKRALINIVKAWNKHNSKDKIIFTNNTSKKKLWKKLNKKLSDKCENEYCWTEQDFLKKKSINLKKRYFRPKMPEEWYKNDREWLNTYDIDKVMKQYELKYKDFHFIGAVPMDFDKKLSFGSCVIDELCNINLKTLLKQGKTKLGVILNLDNHDEEGSHWVSLFCDFVKESIYYFDSYGYKETPEIRHLMDRLKEQGASLNKNIDIHVNTNRHQYKTSECGVYSINFIERLLNNESFDTIANIKVPDDSMFNNRERYFINKNSVE
jgi:hypothetical protein